jgi:peptide/nickel transport system permease protein
VADLKLGKNKPENETEKDTLDVVDEAAGDVRIARASQWQLIKWKFLRHRLAVIGLVVLGLFYFGVIFAEFVAPYNPRLPNAGFQYLPPQQIHFVDQEGRFHLRPFVYKITTAIDPETLATVYTEDKTERYPLHFLVRGDEYELWNLIPGNLHLYGTKSDVKFFALGTDKLGRDMVSLIIHGSRISLSIGLVGIAVSFFLGIIIGGVSGYYGGVVDVVVQRIIEFFRSIPTLPLWMGLSAALPPTWTTLQVYFGIVMILSLIGWTGLARVVRGKFMAIKAEDYVMAAELDGCGDLKIVFKYLLPSFMSYIIANLTLSIPAMILGETSLSFIGLGLQSPAISWGVLLKEAQRLQVLAEAPWLLLPGVFVVIAILAFNFVGDGLRDAADPYAKV